MKSVILIVCLALVASFTSAHSEVTLFDYDFNAGRDQFIRDTYGLSIRLMTFAVDSIKCKAGVELTDVTSIGWIL